MRGSLVLEGRLRIFWMNCCFQHDVMLDGWYLDELLAQRLGPSEERWEDPETGETYVISRHFGRVAVAVELLSGDGDTLIVEGKLEADSCSCCGPHLYLDSLEEELAEAIANRAGSSGGECRNYDIGEVRLTFEEAVDASAALREYRGYLEHVESRAEGLPEEEYLDLLGETKTWNLLVARDELEKGELTAEEGGEIRRLDALLVEHRYLVASNTLPYPEKPRSSWWWHLHDSLPPEERARAAKARERRWISDKLRRIIGKIEHLPRQLEDWETRDDWWRETECRRWREAVTDLEDLERRRRAGEMYLSQESVYETLDEKLKAALPLIEKLGFDEPRVPE